jgi:glutaconate CoA-transferase subunit B
VYETDDLMAIAMAREIRDGDFVAHGSSVPLAAAALMLAKRTHAPNIDYFFQGTLNAAHAGPAELHADMVDIFSSAVASVSHATMIELELRGRCDFHFLRPIQIDRFGNINGSLIGTREQPRARFGGLGLGDVIGLVGRVCLYVTEHSPRVFPEELHFRTGLGHGEGARIREAIGLPGGGPVAVVTPLCVIDFDTPERTARLRSVFGGTTVDEVRERMGFELDVSTVAEHAPPTAEELALLEQIDPLRARRLEFREWRAETRARLAEGRLSRAASPSDR